jgi:hypothetical protein
MCFSIVLPAGRRCAYSPEYLEVSAPCIACGVEVSAHRALILAAQERLLGCVIEDPAVLPATDQTFARNPVSPTEHVPMTDHLLAQDIANNDSWLLPDDVLPDDGKGVPLHEGAANGSGDGYSLPAVGMAPDAEDFPGVSLQGAWAAAEPPPLPEDWVAQQVLEQPQPFSFSGEDWLTQKFATPVQDEAFGGVEDAGEPFQEAVPLKVPAPTAQVRAPRNSSRDSFSDMALIDTEFIAKHGGSSHLPAQRQQGQAPRSEQVDAPFVPTRVIAATGEGDASWKEKHRRKSRGRRRRKRVEERVDRFAGNAMWRPIQGVLALAAVLTMSAFLVWAYKNHWGDDWHLNRIKTGREAREQESRTLEATGLSSDLIPEQALSVERSETDSGEIINETILPPKDAETQPLDLSDNLDFGY